LFSIVGKWWRRVFLFLCYWLQRHHAEDDLNRPSFFNFFPSLCFFLLVLVKRWDSLFFNFYLLIVVLGRNSSCGCIFGFLVLVGMFEMNQLVVILILFCGFCIFGRCKLEKKQGLLEKRSRP
jgi:hypothetical protein